jgi:outer membrane protein assembly factor BamB
MKFVLALSIVLCLLLVGPTVAAEWMQYRGPGGLATSDQTGLPVTWSERENIVFKTALPGPGTSSPIVVSGRIYLTCYSGYGLKPNEGDMNDLVRHVVCVDRKVGRILWTKSFKPELPESQYSGGNNSHHGYSSSTIASDGERLYVFFGKSGVYSLDLDGDQLWHADVGKGTTGWGSSNSPVIYKNLILINASVESRSLVALDKMTGEEVWRASGMRSSWNTPLLVDVLGGKTEAVVVVSGQILGFEPSSGKELWRSKGFGGYICPSPVAHGGIIYAIQGSALAIRSGGRGDVSKTHQLWETPGGATVPSPVYHDGHLYWVRGGGTVSCLNVATGEIVYRKRLNPKAGRIYASVIVADSKLYCVSQQSGTYVLEAQPEFKLLAHNVFEDEDSRTNASPIVDDAQLLLRTDRRLYCIGKK